MLIHIFSCLDAMSCMQMEMRPQALTLLFNCKALPAAQNEQCQLVPQRTLNLRNKQGCQEDTLRSSGKKFSGQF